MKKILYLSVTLVLVLWCANIAQATNGYFSHGYGLKAKGMAGATTAVPQDAMIAASNPAGMAFVGDRFDVGLDWFSPKRSAERTGAGAGSNINGAANSDSTSFFIPDGDLFTFQCQFIRCFYNFIEFPCKVNVFPILISGIVVLIVNCPYVSL